MKKALAAVLLMCLALSTFAGCGNNSKGDPIPENSIVSRLTPEEEFYSLLAQYTPERIKEANEKIEAKKEYCAKVGQFIFKDAKKSFDATKRLIDSSSISFISLNFAGGVETEMPSVEGGKLMIDNCEVTVSGTFKDILKLIDDIQMSPDTGYITKIALEPQTDNEGNDETYVVSLNIEFPYFEDVVGEYNLSTLYTTASGASANTKSLAAGISPEDSMKLRIISEERKWYGMADNAATNYERIISRYTTIKISSLVDYLLNDLVKSTYVTDFKELGISLPEDGSVIIDTSLIFKKLDEFVDFEKKINEEKLFVIDEGVMMDLIEIESSTMCEVQMKLRLNPEHIDKFGFEEGVIDSLEKYGSLLNEKP